MAKEKKQETWQERDARLKKEFEKIRLPEFFKIIEQQDIKYFKVYFSGAGDSGSFDDLYFVPKSEVPSHTEIQKEAGIDPKKFMFSMDNLDDRKSQNKVEVLAAHYRDPLRLGKKYIWTKVQNFGETEITDKRISIEEYILDFVNDYLDVNDIDWYNNEGGHGTAIFENGEFNINGGTFYHEENSFNFTSEAKDYKEKANG